MQRTHRQRQAERVGVHRRVPAAEEYPADEAGNGGCDPGDEPVAEIVAPQRCRRNAVRGEGADHGALCTHEPRQQDERTEYRGDEEQQGQQVCELAEGLDVLVERDERWLVFAGLDDEVVFAGERGRGRHERGGLATVARVQRQLLLRRARHGLCQRIGTEQHTELFGAGHHLLLRACRPEVLGREAAAGDDNGLPAGAAEQVDRAAGLQVERVGEVLFDKDLSGARQPALAQRDARDVGLSTVGDAHDPAQERVVTDTGAEILLDSRRDPRHTGQPRHVIGKCRDVRAAQHDVGKPLRAVRARERVLQVPVRVTRSDEHRDPDRDYHDDREELRPLPPHVTAQLARQNAAHHSRSSASTG